MKVMTPFVEDEEALLRQFLQHWDELMVKYPWASPMSMSDQVAIKCFIHWQQRKERQ